MATLGATVKTLLDWAKEQDPDGKAARIIELLSQTNAILKDMPFLEGNLPVGHRTTVRTGLPSVAWRLLNGGITSSKSTSAQIDEQCGMLEALSEVDVDLAKLNGNEASFRLSEAGAFMQAMNQEMAQTLFYGNSGTAPEEYTGLAIRYSSLSAGNAQNIVVGGGAGSDNTSIWLVGWGPQSVHGIYPKGSEAGLHHKDMGEQLVTVTAGVGGARMRALVDHYQWKCGLALKDWRYVVRIPNIDVSALTTESSAANLIKLMIKAWHRLGGDAGEVSGGKQSDGSVVGVMPVWYMNRTVAQMLDIQRFNVLSGQGTGNQNLGGSIQLEMIDGKHTPTFRGSPIRICDAILETEAAVA